MSAKSAVDDHWQSGSPYERYVGRWSREVAPLFLRWLAPPPRQRFVDVGCGTGALCAAVLEHCAPSLVVGIEPSRGFLDLARQNLAGRALLFQGDATSIPLDDAAVDVVVSGLVLNFVSDQPRALEEMQRVAANGGTIAAYVWDYAGKMEMMRKFWDAAVSLRPGDASQDEGKRFPSCKPAALAGLFTAARLTDVDTTTLDIATPFASFDDFWQPFLGGQGPAPAYAMSLAEADRAALRERIRERLRFRANGSFSLTARAFAVRGTVAK
jgi:SAM-dependent methyltransferase